jgi:hypothetical protein
MSRVPRKWYARFLEGGAAATLLSYSAPTEKVRAIGTSPAAYPTADASEETRHPWPAHRPRPACP